MDNLTNKPNYTGELILAARALGAANPFDPVGMAAQAAWLHELLDLVISRPQDYYFSLMIVGKDGSDPYSHGTLDAALTAVAVMRDLPEEDIKGLAAGRMSGLSYEEIYQDLATIDRPEFWPDYGACDTLDNGILKIELPATPEEIELHRLADDGNPHH